MARDIQQGRLYEAEQVVRSILDHSETTGLRTMTIWGSQITLPVERKFASIESVQTYVDRVLALNWVRAQWDRAEIPVEVHVRRGEAKAHYHRFPPKIAIPLHTPGGGAWALREMIVLHEVAHHLNAEYNDGAHGARFAGVFLALVEGIIGDEAAMLLRSAYQDADVRVG